MRLEEAIARLGLEEGVVSEEEGERVSAIRQAYQADKDKLTKIKTLLVRMRREMWVGLWVGLAVFQRSSLSGSDLLLGVVRLVVVALAEAWRRFVVGVRI